MTEIISAVYDFNEQVIGLNEVTLNPLTTDQQVWLNKFVNEELSEFNEAFAKQDVVAMVDAVWDLIYGAMGTLKKMGLTREQAYLCFTTVHRANMRKKKGVTHRGSAEDAVKPADFVPPEAAIARILEVDR